MLVGSFMFAKQTTTNKLDTGQKRAETRMDALTGTRLSAQQTRPPTSMLLIKTLQLYVFSRLDRSAYTERSLKQFQED